MPRKKASLPEGPKPDSVKREAAMHYFMTGSSVKAAKLMGGQVADVTIRLWNREDVVFQNALDQYRMDNEDYYRSEATKIINKGLRELNDRLDNGESKVERVDDQDEDGKKIRKSLEYRVPVTAKDVSVITGILTDKLRVSYGQPSHISKKAPNQEMAMDQFMEIYKKFENKTVIEHKD